MSAHEVNNWSMLISAQHHQHHNCYSIMFHVFQLCSPRYGLYHHHHLHHSHWLLNHHHYHHHQEGVNLLLKYIFQLRSTRCRLCILGNFSCSGKAAGHHHQLHHHHHHHHHNHHHHNHRHHAEPCKNAGSSCGTGKEWHCERGHKRSWWSVGHHIKYCIITHFDGLMIMIIYLALDGQLVIIKIVYHIIFWWFYLYHYLVGPKLREQWHCDCGHKCSWWSVEFHIVSYRILVVVSFMIIFYHLSSPSKIKR